MIKTQTGKSEIDRLLRKSDQESVLGSLAAADGDRQAAAKHFANSQEYRLKAKELLSEAGDGA